ARRFRRPGHAALEEKPLTPVHETSRVDRLLNACLFWRWDRLRPTGIPSRWRWKSDEERRFWDEQVRPRVEEAWQAPTATRVAEIALELLRRIGLPQSASTGGYRLMPSDLAIFISPKDASASALGRGAHDQPLRTGEPGYDTRSAGASHRDDDEEIAGIISPFFIPVFTGGRNVKIVRASPQPKPKLVIR